MKHKEQLVVLVIWFALLTGVHVFAVVAKSGTAAPGAAQGAASLSTVFAIAGLAAAAASLALRSILLGGFRKGTLTLDTPTGKQRFITGNVVCFALAESPGVFGLVVGMQGAAVSEWLPLIGLSILLLWWHIPLPGRFAPKTDGRLL